ncbi:ankyrin repeat domain-containing protein [Rodentibacter caecimuris]|uniref:Ankyrin repeat domain-containing protein n=1 Tax=Rodentibacter caecimuris TaxID=1796644 RepID=A0ABX3KV95_9PAST|nr:hypothetical protein BKG89_10505 [Rodentibacter heylii]
MKTLLEENKRVVELFEKQKLESPSLQAIVAADEGDLVNLENLFINKNLLNILEKTPTEKWNWLHQILVLCNKDTPPKISIEFFIKNGVEINAQDIYGMTPLHYAMQGKNVEAAIALLNAGADPNIPNIDNLIPLSLIGYIPDRLDVLELMLEKGANVNYLVNEGETILESYKPNKDEAHLLPIYNLMKKYKDRNNL